MDWYISHGAGYALGYAARLGLSDPIKAIDHFARDLRQHWQHKDFGQAYEVKRTKLGLPMTRAGGDQ